MKLRVLYFGMLQEVMGSEGETLSLPSPSSVADLLAALRARAAVSDAVWKSLAVAVNREYAKSDHPLHEDDEVALLPPVSGG